jgi:hypothetical protein
VQLVDNNWRQDQPAPSAYQHQEKDRPIEVKTDEEIFIDEADKETNDLENDADCNEKNDEEYSDETSVFENQPLHIEDIIKMYENAEDLNVDEDFDMEQIEYALSCSEYLFVPVSPHIAASTENLQTSTRKQLKKRK